MTVLILENVTSGFRGEVTQWLLEVKAGVFVGKISGAVRERLWKKVQANIEQGAAILIYSAQNEQGYQMEMCRTPERYIQDFDGLTFVSRIMSKQ